MTRRNARIGDGGGNRRAVRDRNGESAGSYARALDPRAPGASRHWMRDSDPPRMDFGAHRESHAGYGDYGTRDYDPRPEGEPDHRTGGRSGREPESAALHDRVGRERLRSFAGRGPRNYRRSDERIRETICERLTDDPHVDASDVTVEVEEGVVTLAGSVTERRMKHRIEDLVADAARDNEIRNDIRIRS